MASLLWQTQEISQFGMENEPGYGEIEVRLDGLAGFYFDRRQQTSLAQSSRQAADLKP
jgi:hypothetical protein